jgi:16S rRNA (uracil1498-N3)-methyltransferase
VHTAVNRIGSSPLRTLAGSQEGPKNSEEVCQQPEKAVLRLLAIIRLMPDRYYSATPINDSTVNLEGSEAHHLLHVMRAQPGMPLVVFDGRGGEFAAEVVHCQRRAVELAVGERQPIERELPFPLTLAVALPKGDRQRWLIEKAVELGVRRLVPLRTLRSVGNSEPGQKLARYVVEASKQCGRNRLLEIASPLSWPAFLAGTTAEQCLLAHPGGRPIANGNYQPNDEEELLITVGPEGGFSDEAAPSEEPTGGDRDGKSEHGADQPDEERELNRRAEVDCHVIRA